MEKSKMAELLEKIDFTPRSLSKGETVEGTIISKIADSLLVDIGTKAEGIIPIKEVEEAGLESEIGKTLSAMVAQPDNDSGVVILTLRKTQKDKIWEDLQGLQESGQTLDVRALEANRGGLVVEYQGVRGFVPSSHLSNSAKELLGKKLVVRVLEANKNLNKLVLSEKEPGEKLPKIELPFKIGDTLKVSVSKILPFGLLVALKEGGEGLIHISEISWTRVENITEIYQIGQELEAKVISIDPQTGRVNLSIKQLEEDPWEKAAKKYKVGTVLEKNISRLAGYGAFVELEKGIEGLIHSSKIPYGKELKVGEPVKVSIDLFNTEQRRVALRLAQEDKSENNSNQRLLRSKGPEVEKHIEKKRKPAKKKTE